MLASRQRQRQQAGKANKILMDHLMLLKQGVRAIIPILLQPRGKYKRDDDEASTDQVIFSATLHP